MRTGAILLLLLASAGVAPAGWVKLLNGRDLGGWESIGDGVWTIMRDGTLVGQRDLRQKPQHQAWLYTKKDFGEFDLHLEWWLRLGGNSGVSIRDSSRAQYAVGDKWDAQKTPAHIGYEIQLINGYKEKYPSGSVYLFEAAKTGVQHDNDWNSLDIESRNGMIRVKINGQPVSESPGDPERPKTGPIGLQLHDSSCVVMFRNIRIRETGK